MLFTPFHCHPYHCLPMQVLLFSIQPIDLQSTLGEIHDGGCHAGGGQPSTQAQHILKHHLFVLQFPCSDGGPHHHHREDLQLLQDDTTTPRQIIHQTTFGRPVDAIFIVLVFINYVSLMAAARSSSPGEGRTVKLGHLDDLD